MPETGLEAPVMTPTLPATAFLILLTLGYLGTCVAWPFGNCSRCGGSGKRPSPFGRAFRICRRCDGTGRRLRIGRHVINALSRLDRPR